MVTLREARYRNGVAQSGIVKCSNGTDLRREVLNCVV